METIDTFRPKYQAFLESNMSARAFCGQIGMNESHFYYWQAKICKEAARQNGEFLPVSISNHARKVVRHRKPAESVAIEYVLHKAVRKDDIERTIRCAAAPQAPIVKSYASSTVLATNLMAGKYVYSLPFYRQIEMMKRLGMDGYAVCDYYEGKSINYAVAHYDRLCRYVIDGRYRIDPNLVENGQRPVALTRKNYLFCKNHDAAEDAAVMYTKMGFRKFAKYMSGWLTYIPDYVHESDL